jgi:hypothetical protein
MSRWRWYASWEGVMPQFMFELRINIPVHLMLMGESCIHLHTSPGPPNAPCCSIYVTFSE